MMKLSDNKKMLIVRLIFILALCVEPILISWGM